MSTVSENLAARVKEHFGDSVSVDVAYGEVTMIVDSKNILQVCTELRDNPELAFEQLIDLCGVDYLTYGGAEWATSAASSTGFGRAASRGTAAVGESERRFAVAYHLLSVALNQRLRVKVYLDAAEPIVDSVVEIWRGVDWFEREAFDMYGVLFAGHPDLRRILTDYGFIGHPFRKDFPLSGHVEMRYDPEQQRVVYETVSVEPRVLVPRVIREDNRYESGAAPAE